MDFLTGMAYWGILALVIVNAILVARMKVTIEDSDDDDSPDAQNRECTNPSKRMCP
ncbi:MAG: hypothetical protein JSU96_01895 [Acidobacteriota bacterium]|nr:MAG: hypothetical protein JSU96_01895 [Acidobacteriota bacterium]